MFLHIWISQACEKSQVWVFLPLASNKPMGPHAWNKAHFKSSPSQPCSLTAGDSTLRELSEPQNLKSDTWNETAHTWPQRKFAFLFSMQHLFSLEFSEGDTLVEWTFRGIRTKKMGPRDFIITGKGQLGVLRGGPFLLPWVPHLEINSWSRPGVMESQDDEGGRLAVLGKVSNTLPLPEKTRSRKQSYQSLRR